MPARPTSDLFFCIILLAEVSEISEVVPKLHRFGNGEVKVFPVKMNLPSIVLAGRSQFMKFLLIMALMLFFMVMTTCL